MKKFPRIYSLCTVGLIHHGEYEYLFHPFRTDFIGDSGSGKSMVADLLQLILVGYDKFKSATEVAGEKRTIDGIVFTSMNTSGIGYAFLNVEIAPKQYVVIGAALQSGNQRTRAFVAQAGNVFSGDSLEPLSAPLSYSALIRQTDNAILPLEQVGLHLFEQGIVLRTYEQFAGFHELLIANRLLPLKSTANQQAIADYATIIRSFARGYKVEANKSNALQQFLFGRSERNSLLDRLKYVQQEIDKHIHSHNRNIDDVEEFKAKLTDFKELLRRGTEYNQTKVKWVVANFHCAQQTQQRRQQNVANLCERLNQDVARLNTICPIVNSLRGTLPEAVEKANKIYQEAVARKADLKSIVQAVATVQAWLAALSPTATFEQLTAAFTLDQKRQAQRDQINTLLNLLAKEDLTKVFLKSAWIKGFEAGYEQHQQELNRLDTSIRKKTQLAALADLDAPTSLAYWAAHLDRPLTLEEESLLRHFQHLPTTKPTRETHKTDDRYIPSAKVLFANPSLTIDEDQPATYWANLSGVWERIEQVKDPLFATNDKQALRQQLQQWNSDLQQEIQRLTAERNTLTALATCLRGSSNVTDLLVAYSERTQVEQFKFNSDWVMAPGDFDKLLTQYRAYATRIETDLEQADKAVEDTLKALNEVGQQNTWIEQIAQIVDEWTPAIQYVNVLNQQLSKRPEFTLRTDGLLANPVDRNLRKLLNNLQVSHQNRITIDRWINEIKLLVEAEQQQHEAQKRYASLFDYTPEKIEAIEAEEVDQLKNLANQAWTRYEDEYQRLTKRYLPDQQHLVNDSICDFMLLANEVLPPQLRNTVKSGDEIISAIETELLRINNQVRMIANSIIQDAGKVVAELGQIISEHKAARSAINTFFQSQTRPITNNCSVKLGIKQGIIHEEWITEFAELIDRLETPLFPSARIDAESLRDKKDLTSLIKTAFKQVNGGNNFDIDLILDPFNYYELSFGMYYENGQPNKGSTGQTYAALALLSVARLSIVEAGSPKNPAPGLRIMPIDEAEGLGSNFTMLADIARQYDYQLIAMSIGPVGRYQENEQYVYMLQKDQSTDEAINYPPFGILSAQDAHHLSYRYYDAKD